MREGGQILVLPSEEEAGGLPSRTHGESFNDKYNEKSDETNTSGDNHVPEDGFYRYRTNPNPATDPWIITGAMKVNRILTDEEVDDLVRKAGREPQKREPEVRFSKVSDEERARIRAYDSYFGTDVLGFLDYAQNGWDGNKKSWKVARIKSSGFPTLVDAAKHGKMPVVGDLFIESDVFNPVRHAFHVRGDKSQINPNHVLTQSEWANVIDYLSSDSPKIIAIANANNLDAFALYPPFRHHNGLPMVVVLEQAEKTKRAKKAYVITAFGEYDEVTRKKTFLYGSYNKVKGIPTVHVDQANPDTTTSWQIPSEGKDTKNLQYSKIDSEYLAAVESGDMEKAQQLVNEAARIAGYDANTDYHGSIAFNGAAPTRNGYFETREERKAAFDDGSFEDTYSLGDYMAAGIDNNDLEWILANPIPASERDEATLESIRNLNKAVSGKKGTIKMYRAVPADVRENSFRNGDWVTPSRQYAQHHIELQDWEGGRIIEQEVSADDIWWNGDDINEWGYDDGKNYAYKNTPNNRKLLDPVTYDDNGDVIPLSERSTRATRTSGSPVRTMAVRLISMLLTTPTWERAKALRLTAGERMFQ